MPNNIIFSDDEALGYVQLLENPNKVGWDKKNKVWRTPKQEGFDKNQIAYGLDIREENNPIVYNYLKSKGRLNDPWLTDREAKDLMALTWGTKKSTMSKIIEKTGGNMSQRGYNVAAGMIWHGHPAKMMLNPDSVTGKAFTKAVASGDRDLNSVFDAYYGYGSNATQFADRIRLDKPFRGDVLEFRTGDGNKILKFKVNKQLPYESTWKPEQSAKTIYPLSGLTETPELLSSWKGASAPNITPRLKDFLEIRQEDLNRGVNVFGDPLSPFSLRLKPPSLTSLLQLNSPEELAKQYFADALGISNIMPEMPSLFPRLKNGKLPCYRNGKDDFEEFKLSLPSNQRNTPEWAYSTKRYWELHGKPKTFGEAIGQGMYTYDFSDNAWHANSVSYNKDTGEYEFMKPNYHDTKMYEDAWYYSKAGEEFRKDYTKGKDSTGIYDKYVPRKKKGLIGLKNGKLPRYADGDTPEYADATWHENWLNGRKKQFEENVLSGNGDYGNAGTILGQINNIKNSRENYNIPQRAGVGGRTMQTGSIIGYNVIEYPTSKEDTSETTKVHERTHAANNWNNKETPQEQKVRSIQTRYGIDDGYQNTYDYSPAEQYARINEARKRLGLAPDYIVTKEDVNRWHLDDMLDPRLVNVGYDALVKMFNEVAYAPLLNSNSTGIIYAKDGKLPGYSNGKPIRIKPENRGKLTRLKKRTGKSESELYNDGNPAHRKMVVFARNARKWKH